MSIDPRTGIKPISEWGSECGRGFVSDARFGSGQVIKRTNRDSSRKWRKVEGGVDRPAATGTNSVAPAPVEPLDVPGGKKL